MSLVLHQHPFAAYCQKVIAALYELELPFESRIIEGDEGREELARLWPLAGIPLLIDEAAGVTVPESTTIIEYLDGHARYGDGGDDAGQNRSSRGGGEGGKAGASRLALIPRDPRAALDARLWDRIADQYLSTPMQKIVGDELRPEGARDLHGVARAREQLDVAYGVLDDRLAEHPWAGGATFTIADCALYPPLFYLWAIHRWDRDRHANITRYYRDLLARPSVARVIDEARPYRPYLPLPWPADQDVLAPS